MHIVLLAMGLAILVKVPIASVLIVGQFTELLEDSAHMLSNLLGSVEQVVDSLPYRSTILGAVVCLAILPLSPSAEHSVEDGPYSVIVNGELGVERPLSFMSFVRVLRFITVGQNRRTGNKLEVNAGIFSAGLGVTRVILHHLGL